VKLWYFTHLKWAKEHSVNNARQGSKRSPKESLTRPKRSEVVESLAPRMAWGTA